MGAINFKKTFVGLFLLYLSGVCIAADSSSVVQPNIKFTPFSMRKFLVPAQGVKLGPGTNECRGDELRTHYVPGRGSGLFYYPPNATFTAPITGKYNVLYVYSLCSPVNNVTSVMRTVMYKNIDWSAPNPRAGGVYIYETSFTMNGAQGAWSPEGAAISYSNLPLNAGDEVGIAITFEATVRLSEAFVFASGVVSVTAVP